MEMDECPICFYPLDERFDNATLECKHTFHLKCLKDWYNKQNTNYKCPLCNIPRSIINIKEKTIIKQVQLNNSIIHRTLNLRPLSRPTNRATYDEIGSDSSDETNTQINSIENQISDITCKNCCLIM